MRRLQCFEQTKKSNILQLDVVKQARQQNDQKGGYWKLHEIEHEISLSSM